MNKEISILRTEIEICDKHAARIKYALDEINKSIMPISAKKILNLPNPHLDILDTLIMRFSKMQDHIGQKVFPNYLKYLQENIEHKSFIDILNLLEKLKIIPSVQFWRNLRSARNNISHEYPDKPDLMVDALLDCIDKGQKLIDYWQELRKKINSLKPI